MPSSFPRSPRLLKGALVTVDSGGPVHQAIVFQYNPNTLTRTLEAQIGEGEGADALRFTGAPVETIKLEAEIDATDQLERADANAVDMGIYPQLSALELLLYPRSGDVITNNTLLNIGTIEIVPPAVPLTLFIWGSRRILPVRLTEFSITEEAHSPDLSPLRAKVSLGLRVLSYSDLTADHPGWSLFVAHQVVKETMASVAVVNNVDAALGDNVQPL
jgi:hypothetical protein